MAYSLYDAAVTPCAQQLGALAGIIDKAAAHCAANKIEESVLLQDRLYPDMFCLARQIRQSADFAINTGGRLAGVTPPALPAVDDTSFAAAKSRVETALGFVKSLTREQVDGAEGKVIAWTAGSNNRKIKGNDYLQQFALPNFFFFVTTAYDILRHRGVPLGKRDFLGPVNWLYGASRHGQARREDRAGHRVGAQYRSSDRAEAGPRRRACRGQRALQSAGGRGGCA